MAEYIEHEAFKKSVEERYCKPCKAEGKDHNGCWCRACWVDDMLDEVECFQPADVVPVVHGEWYGNDCTVCKLPWNYNMVQDADDWGYFDPMPDYCPNCGAIMDGGDNNAVD